MNQENLEPQIKREEGVTNVQSDLTAIIRRLLCFGKMTFIQRRYSYSTNSFAPV